MGEIARSRPQDKSNIVPGEDSRKKRASKIFGTRERAMTTLK